MSLDLKYPHLLSVRIIHTDTFVYFDSHINDLLKISVYHISNKMAKYSGPQFIINEYMPH